MSGTLTATDDAGFTMIEVLVAFVIVALGLVAFYGGLGISNRQLGESRIRHVALAYAQSHLAGLGHAGPLEPGSSTGAYASGLTWRLSISELPGSTGRALPRLVMLEAFDRNARPLTRLRTVKLAPVQP